MKSTYGPACLGKWPTPGPSQNNLAAWPQKLGRFSAVRPNPCVGHDPPGLASTAPRRTGTAWPRRSRAGPALERRGSVHGSARRRWFTRSAPPRRGHRALSGGKTMRSSALRGSLAIDVLTRQPEKLQLAPTERSGGRAKLTGF
jgi:hypothetical protein